MFLKDGDANTRFFHLQACHRNRKNMITHLMHNGVPIVDENLKAEVIVNHFDQIMGSVVQSSDGVNLDYIGLPRGQLPALDQFFSEDEVWNVIRSLPPYKAPDLDGFMGCFLQAAWPVIKRDFLRALAAIWSLDNRSLFLLNQAYMVLLRKKPNTSKIRDFRPISLIHCFSKLFAKLLSCRLTLHMHLLVRPNQSAFICGQAIHDNFRAVQSSAKLLHAR
jgi:hypothetical protein